MTVACALALAGAEPSARQLRRQAAAAERAGNFELALFLYNQAISLDGGNAQDTARAGALVGSVTQQAPASGAAAAAEIVRPDLEAPPDPSIFQPITDREIRQARELLPPPELAMPAGVFDFDLRTGGRDLWNRIGTHFGFTVLFDDEYGEGGQPLRLRSEAQGARQTLQALAVATGSFAVPLGEKKILVVKDTVQKRQEREPTVAVVLSLPDPLNQQELQEAARVVQQVMEIQKFAIDGSRRMVLLRDRLSKVRPAQMLFEQLLGARPAVVVELEIFEMRSTRETEAGVRLPTAARIFNLSRLWNNVPETPSAAYATFGAGRTVLGLEVADASVAATMLKSYGASRMRSFVQTISGMPATFLAGEKYPILTAGYFGDTSGGGDLFRPPPTFQFENLGVQLKITPVVHGTEEVTLEVESEFKLLTGAEINGIPVLSNRKFNSTIRVREGEWGVMAGLSMATQSVNVSGIPGLMQVPVLGPLLRTNTLQNEAAEALLVLKPRLLGLPPSARATTEIFLGPEGRPAMPL
jgi:general secretion pathway protein D